MDALELLDQPAHRRWWLLIKALECGRLDQALVLVHKAEQFLFAGTTEGRKEPSLQASFWPPVPDEVPSEPSETEASVIPATPERQVPFAAPTVNGKVLPITAPRPPVPLSAAAPSLSAEREASCGLPEPPAPSSGPLLSTTQSDEIRRRLAAGATNAELAAEFAMKPRQVQGLRMGMARMAKRDHPQPVRPAPAHSQAEISVAAEEIIRYLRQQDDVVVPAGPGTYLVNSRFRVGLAELLKRANHMRLRQDKPPFTLDQVERLPPRINGH